MLRCSFSPTCSSQVPSYIDLYDDFKSKGVNDIYCVAVNDAFVIKAWKKDMFTRASKDENATNVKFAADDAGSLAAAVGLVLNAQEVFGGPRMQRAAIVYDNGVVTHVAVEPNPGQSEFSLGGTERIADGKLPLPTLLRSSRIFRRARLEQ